MYRAGIKHLAADALSRLPTAGTKKTKLNDKVPVLNINTKTFKFVHKVEVKQEEQEPNNYSTSKRSFALFFPEVFNLAHKTEESKLDIASLQQFITAQTAQNECRIALVTVGQPKTFLSCNADSVLMRVSAVHRTSKRYVPKMLKPLVLCLCHY